MPVQAGRLLDAYDEFRSRSRLSPLSLLANQQQALETSLQQLQQQRLQASNTPGATALSAQCTAVEAQV